MAFRFKQFIVDDSLCAMKVGTDGVLLGAWAAFNASTPQMCLDIGTGSGLIALMLAQCFPKANIVGIDIDAEAVAQANANFAASLWSTRLHAEHTSLQDFHLTPSGGDKREASLIVSNPPFFCNSLKNPDAARAVARHTDTLSYNDLITHAARLLAPNGIFSVILPAEAETEFVAQAQQYGLSLVRLCAVRGNARKPIKRVMMDFIKGTAHISTRQELVLMDDNNQRSADYAALTNDFYL